MDRRIDRQTDMAKLIVPFRNFANAPKNYIMAAECWCSDSGIINLQTKLIFLYKILATSFDILSSHHQAIQEYTKGKMYKNICKIIEG